jgi:hypothetical protein
VCGKVNFSNLSRYSNLSERTYRRQFAESFDFTSFNAVLIEEAVSPKSRKIAAMDCSFITKSGKQSYGVDYYYNGSASKSETGQEISVISIVDVDSHQGYTLSVQQTAAKEAAVTTKPLEAKPKVKKQAKQGKKTLSEGRSDAHRCLPTAAQNYSTPFTQNSKACRRRWLL